MEGLRTADPTEREGSVEEVGFQRGRLAAFERMEPVDVTELLHDRTSGAELHEGRLEIVGVGPGEVG